ncbi:MAG: SDR family NAD(P)-dependent oxidoreductase [Chloroflexota bacterium]
MAGGLFDLTGKVALVTGGNGGIGKAIGVALASAGANIAVAARNRDKTSQAVQEIQVAGGKALGLSCDVTSRDDVEAAVSASVEQFGGLDILVNNSGTTVREFPQNLADEDWQRVLDVNLTGTFLGARAAYPSLKARGAGKIINVGSMLSIFGNEYASAYAASKGGVVQFTRSCAVAWAQDNIQVNAILPGWITTDMTAGLIEKFPERYQMIVDRTPTGRWGVPDDVAGTAVFLASRASDFVTGVSIPVDGGYSVK